MLFKHSKRKCRPRVLSLQDMVFLVFVIVFFAFEIYAFSVARITIKKELPKNYGNFGQITNRLTTNSPEESFSFGVVGDTVSSPTFRAICGEFHEHPLSFIIMVGDFANRCSKPYHDFFKYECINSYHLSVPTFLIAGNRDFDYDNTYNNDISIDDFNSLYGSENFFFEYADCLFIGVGILRSPTSSEEGMTFLENTLSSQRKPGQKVFVLTHISPLDGSDSLTKEFKNSQRFLDLVNRHGVDYVIAGHFHGYSRFRQKNTEYIITGGGGASLKETKSFNGLHHAMVMTINSDSVQEDVILVKERKRYFSALPYYAIAKFYPLMSNNPFALIGINFLVIFLIFKFAVNFISKQK